MKEASFYHVCNLFDDAVFIDVNSWESYDRVIKKNRVSDTSIIVCDRITLMKWKYEAISYLV